MKTDDLKLRRINVIEAQNSLGYLDKVFTYLTNANCFANDKNAYGLKDSETLEIQFSKSENAATGWYNGQEYIPNDSREIAQIAFTSGTEGKPKGICLSHSNLKNTTQRIVIAMEMDSSIKEYVGVPVTFSFGFGRCRAVSLVGGQFFIPSNGFDPNEIASMLANDEINAISAVPSLWRVLFKFESLFKNIGHKVKWIEIGSQYMSEEEKLKMLKLFPNAKIAQHYGLTEASRSTFLRIDLERDNLESVGKPLSGTDVKLTDRGLIKIKGPHVANCMLVGEELVSLKDDEGYFLTNDKGSLKNGFLYYEGRADDIANIAGIKVSPDILEREISLATNIHTGFAVIKVSDEMKGESVILAVESSTSQKTHLLFKSFKQSLNLQGITGISNKQVFEVDSLPRTETNKVQKKLVASSYYNNVEMNKSTAKNQGVTDQETEILNIWKSVLKVENISVNENFFDLGGDSLSAIQVIMEMEAAGLDKELCRKIFKGYTISQIIVASSSSEKPQKIHAGTLNETFNIVKGILVLLNISAHWALGVVERLGGVFLEINRYFASFYSSGTPGFAIAFGIGIGAYTKERYDKDPLSVNKLVWRNVKILGIGITALALVRLCDWSINKPAVSAMDIAHAFYSVIFYYFFAVLSIPLWLKAISGKSSELKLLLLASVFYGIHTVISTVGITPSENPFIQMGILLLTAKYNYFEMSAWVLLGLYVGSLLIKKSNIISGDALIFLGSLLIILAISMSFQLEQQALWLIFPKVTPWWGWLFYFGSTLLLLKLTFSILSKQTIPGLLTKLFAATGVLAFPLFISHAMVIPLKNVLSGLGIPMALSIAMSLFLLFYVYMYRKVSKFYFS
ncbi:AMP-binding protein [Pseudoalteromonas sp. SSM20]|uniref:AMP-binding protein n=1 Tax=Pseudoalteromonas sp. SSM20 TaxID=3139394 RepID=UPI003BA878E2